MTLKDLEPRIYETYEPRPGVDFVGPGRLPRLRRVLRAVAKNFEGTIKGESDPYKATTKPHLAKAVGSLVLIGVAGFGSVNLLTSKEEPVPVIVTEANMPVTDEVLPRYQSDEFHSAPFTDESPLSLERSQNNVRTFPPQIPESIENPKAK